MAYDRDSQTVVLFGGLAGQDPSDVLNDTWTWDGVRWTERQPVTRPPGMQGGNMAFDQPRHRVVLFKGGQTWTWDGSNWTQEHPRRSPSVDCCPGMAYDAALLEVVLFGAGPALDETWTWDGATWTQLRPPVHPQGRQRAAMTYDAAHDTIVLYGGIDPFHIDAVLGDTWTFDGVTWTRSQPSSSPPPRLAASLTYDDALKAGILFGGRSDATRYNATWRWDGVIWTRLIRLPPPPGSTFGPRPTMPPANRSSSLVEADLTR
jgi:hypothetical protein